MISYFGRHPTAPTLLFLGMIALGFTGLSQLQRETFPHVSVRDVIVTVPFRSATALEVEREVCQPVEEAVETIQFIDKVSCEASEGVGVARVKMMQGADIDRMTAEVRSAVAAIQSFPPQVEEPVVEQVGEKDFVAAVAVAMPYDAVTLQVYVEDLRDRLEREADISSVSVRGFSQRQLRIDLDAGALRAHGLTPQQVANSVAAQNVDLPGGSLIGDGGETTMRINDERREASTILDLVVIETANGGSIRLGDVATARETFEHDWDYAVFDGKRAALLEVEKRRDQDSIDVMADLVGFLEQERQRIPEGGALEVTWDMASIVEDRLSMLMENGWQGIVLVFFVLWMFLGLRYGFWVAMGLPTSFLGAFFVMSQLGYSIDMISMVGLLVGIGLLMDDSIVIAENIAEHRRRGESPMDAAVNGTLEVAPGVASSFVTTICIFGALSFMSGSLGEVLRVMPIMLLIVLTVSLADAFLILPHHLSHGRPGATGGLFRRAFDGTFAAFRRWVIEPLALLAVRLRYATIGVALVLVATALALGASGTLKFSPFPKLEGNFADARILMPQGTSLTQTEAVVAKVVGVARALEAEHVAQGHGPLINHVTVAHGSNPDTSERGSNVATVTLDLVPFEERTLSLPQVLQRWREGTGAVPDATLAFTELEIGPAGGDIDIRLKGDDLVELNAAADELRTWLAGFAGIRDPSDSLRPGKPEMLLRLKPGATALGVTADSLAQQMRTAFGGLKIDEFQRNGQTIEIVVRLRPEDRADYRDLDDFFVMAAGGAAAIPLSQVAEIEEGRGWARIERENGQRMAAVKASVDPALGNAPEIIAMTQAEFLPGLMERYPGMTYAIEGAIKETGETLGSVSTFMLLGIMGIYIVLAIQFRSFWEPLVVAFGIPLALIGAFWGHFLLGYDLTMPSLVGLAALTGVVVNDSILLVLFLKERLHQYGDPALAGAAAAGDRLRAILLTSLTTFAGLVPLLAETSLQAQLLIPLAISLAFGLMGATFLCLFVIPALYGVLDDLHLTERYRGAHHTDDRAQAPHATAAQPAGE